MKPDETPNTDACNGYIPREHDLVVVGDAESAFHTADHAVFVDSQVARFRSPAMAAKDVQRSSPTLSASCQAQAAKQEHVTLVHYALLGRPKCTCDFGVSAIVETKTKHAGLNSLTIATWVREGAYEANILTTVGKSTTNAQAASGATRTALLVQGIALKALLARLHVG